MKFLLIGQGLAGTVLGYRLEQAGHEVHYTDAPRQTAASAVAAGIVNPITGRRFVKSWRIDELLPEAKTLYTDLERELGVPLWFEQPLIRTLYNRGDLNDWQARSADPGYPEYMDDVPDPGRITELTDPVFAYAGVRHAARVDMGALVLAFRERLVREGRFKAEVFDYSTIPSLLRAEQSCGALSPGPSTRERGDGAGGNVASNLRDDVPTDSGRRRAGAPPLAAAQLKKVEKSKEPVVNPQATTYDHIISCEGWRARHNPYFSYLPHGGNKGEILIVKTAKPVLDRMFKHRVFLVPQTDGTYWVGATSANQFSNDSPTPDNRKFLEDRLAEVLTGTDYEIVGHRAAVRPTVRDRRMFLGTHPELERLHIFNGLGTKGASLAPLGSRWLADYLLAGKEIPKEVNISRFR